MTVSTSPTGEVQQTNLVNLTIDGIAVSSPRTPW